jgi:hypothetical protein
MFFRIIIGIINGILKSNLKKLGRYIQGFVKIADIFEGEGFLDRYGGVYEKSDRLFSRLLRVGVQQQLVCWWSYQCPVGERFKTGL